VPVTEQLSKADVSLLKRYQDKVLGDDRLLQLLQYELTTFLFGNLSGALGYVLRKKFYRCLFKKVGSGIIFGKGLVIRHPQRITLGDRVAIDDYGLVDAVGVKEEGLILGEDVIVSRNCIIQGKTGPLVIGKKTIIGPFSSISSVTGIYIGQSVLIGGNCYIGGARYISDRLDIPMMAQGIYSQGHVIIGDDVWLGTGVVVLDGVHIGKGCIVGAGAVVTKNLPDYAVATGVPARVIRKRTEGAQ